MRTFQHITVDWKDITPFVRSFIPPLTFSDHKGSMGRIGVIGGSSDYTGAPYYAGSSALKFGADLSTVFCSRDASTPIKTYSPELMVTGVYDDRKVEYVDLSNQINLAEAENEILKMVQKVKDFLPRLHSLVVGPGLGRNHFVMKGVAEIVEAAKAREMNMVFDADSLWLLANNLSLIRGYTRCILTPNKVEFDRLVQALVNELDGTKNNAREEDETLECNNPSIDPFSESLRAELLSKDPVVSARAVSLALGGVPVLAKGEKDIFTAGGDVFEMNQPLGSPRRCGGQGDILAGTLGVAVFWGNQLPGTDFVDFASQLPSSSTVKCETHNTSVEIDDIVAKYKKSHGHQVVESNSRAIMTKGLGRAMPDKTILSTEMKTSPSAAYRRRQTILLAGMFASATIRRASELTFNTVGRSMISPDILQNIGPAFEDLTSTDEGKA